MAWLDVLLVVVHLCIGADGFIELCSYPHTYSDAWNVIQRTWSDRSSFSISKGDLSTSRTGTASGFDGDGYSRCLSRKEERDQVMREERYALVDRNTRLQKAIKFPFKAVRKVFPQRDAKPGALILIRCGESWWNRNQTFTGWADPDLTLPGMQEGEHAGRLLLEAGYEPDVVYTSRLKRAIHSVFWILQEINASYLPVYKSWRLNERMYGALQGLSKKETAKRLGADVVQAWRNSIKARPPPMKLTDSAYPGKDRKYCDLSANQIPLTESLADCMERTRPLWEYKISRDLAKGNNVMVVAHGNTLRGLMKIIDGISDSKIKDVNMPKGIPFVYRFNSTMGPITPSEGSLTQIHTSGIFLEKPGLLRDALKRQEKWQNLVPGLEDGAYESRGTKRVTTLEKSLLKLKEEQKVQSFGNVGGETIAYSSIEIAPHANGKQNESLFGDPSQFEESFNTFGLTGVKPGNVQSLPPEGLVPGIGQTHTQKDAVVVLIRHGKTPHNELGLFTGWEDPPLTEEGVQQAKHAGRLLKMHGFEFDVVYSSWLTRAIETACYALDELDSAWLPIIKSWRLNERMYGALTGKSKKMVANKYGEEQLKKWRRGYKIRPPPTPSYSLSYPGNDDRRTKYVKDIRISWSETLFRTIQERKLIVHRKFPKTESLKDCMDRSIPFYTERIVPEAVAKGKRVLITSHENAIRGILMHLCDIPEEAMNGLHLPNGLPLVYSVKRKCITLLDDGSGTDPMQVHDFGPASKYLFRPCELGDDFYDEMVKVGASRKEVLAI